MKKVLFLFIFGILISACASRKNENIKIRYFDENNIEISKAKFNRIRATNKLLDIPGDSVNQKKLILREKHGKINDRKAFELTLENELNLDLDPNKPIVIIYYPGKDPCNSSGIKNSAWIKNWKRQLEEGLAQVAQVKPVYIYKEKGGLKKYDGIIDWKKDPNGMVESLFFKHHYPCSSFVVISKNGDYISYFGEFSIDYVWEATQLMNK